MGKTLDQLKREYYLSVVPGATELMTLTDLEVLFYTSPPVGGGGFTPTAWTDITNFAVGAAATADVNIPALKIRKDQEDVARLKGGVDFSAVIAAGATIMTMPAAFIPQKDCVVVARLPSVFTRVIINSDGTVTLNVATSAGTTLNLDGITYTLVE